MTYQTRSSTITDLQDKLRQVQDELIKSLKINEWSVEEMMKMQLEKIKLIEWKNEWKWLVQTHRTQCKCCKEIDWFEENGSNGYTGIPRGDPRIFDQHYEDPNELYTEVNESTIDF
jgi:hypothetical protein